MADAPIAAPAAAPTSATPDMNTHNNAQPPLPGGVPGAQGGDVKSAAAEAMRKYKVKVEGQDLEVDEKELLRGYGHQRVANKALQEGKALRAQSEQILKMLNNDDELEVVLKKMGKDPRQIAEKILSRHLEDELMDPKDRELRNLKAEIARREAIEKKVKEDIAQKHHEQRVETMRQKYEKEFLETLEASKLPKTKVTVARMAGYIAQCARLGYEITPSEAAQLLAEDLRLEHKAIIDEGNMDSLISLYGEENINKLRQYDTARVKNPSAQLKTPLEKPSEPRERGKPRKRMSIRDWQMHKRGLK